jgi:hypothetical protein
MGSAVRGEVFRPLMAGGLEQVSRLVPVDRARLLQSGFGTRARSAFGLTGGTDLEKVTAPWKTLHQSVLRFGG